MHVRAQNAAVVVRILVDHVRFEIFEVSPSASSVKSTDGKLLCSYPGPAIQISSDIFSSQCFLGELASFLIQMDVDVLDSTDRDEDKDKDKSAHPRYISELLVGILRGFGQPASIDRITKRIADEVLRDLEYVQPWRRLPLWLVIRVTLQTSLGADMYKPFILFLHAHILQICIQKGFPSEILYLMRVKMVRRLSKLGPSVSDNIYQIVQSTAKETEELLQNRWSRFQQSQSATPPWHPDQLDIVSDTAITLNNSRPYLINALRSTFPSHSPQPFNPSHQPRLADTTDFRQFSEGRLEAAIKNDSRVALADFELSVERHLDFWVGSSQHDDDGPDVIASCAMQYFTSAKKIYGNDPEENSIMVLTILDLWKALDGLTIRQCPLLKSYSPEIPGNFLHPLLLHRTGSLRHAELIEKYILRRHEEASGTKSIFSDDLTESSFALRYYRDSPRLQELHTEIEQYPQQKRTELSDLNEKWKSLKDAASRMRHTSGCVGYSNIRESCERCRTNDEADSLKIEVFEWTLPRSTAQAQLLVFELAPPPTFSAWRDITYMILHDIGKSKPKDSKIASKSTTISSKFVIGRNIPTKSMLLVNVPGLRRCVKARTYHRITLLAKMKSKSKSGSYPYWFLSRDRTSVRIPVGVEDVLLDNGLGQSLKLFDRIDLCRAAYSSAPTIAHACARPFPKSSPYKKIHSFVSGTHHTSNEVIASQADCPPELSLHEYIAFSALRSGPRLQWLNIAREFSSTSLSLRSEEIHTLITQAAWQLGPLSDGVREWHTDLDIPSFGKTLLGELDSLLGRIEVNWLEEVTIRTIGMLLQFFRDSSSNSTIYSSYYQPPSLFC